MKRLLVSSAALLFFAAVAGSGLTLFQQVIPRPGLATGIYLSTRRIGAVVSGLILRSARRQLSDIVRCSSPVPDSPILALIVIWVAGRARRPSAVPQAQASTDG